MRSSATLSRTLVLERSWPVVLDLTVAAFCLATFYCVVLLGRYWFGHPVPSAQISQSARALPLYAFYSIVRIGVAYLLSLIFAVGYGYYRRISPARRSVHDRRAGHPAIDSGAQLSAWRHAGDGLALAHASARRRDGRHPAHLHRPGLEHGLQLLLLHPQHSARAARGLADLRLHRVAAVLATRASLLRHRTCLELHGLGRRRLVLPHGLRDVRARRSRLPPSGPRLVSADRRGQRQHPRHDLGPRRHDRHHRRHDQLVWRPVIAWADKFKFEQVESSQVPTSPILYALRNSNAIGWLHQQTIVPLGERIYHNLAARRLRALARPERSVASRQRSLIANSSIFAVLLVAAIFAAFHAVLLLRQLHGAEIVELLKGAGATFLRVNASLLIAALWTIPAGVAIGFHPRLARIAQPVAQIAASVPATALFPVLLIALVHAGGGLGIGSIALMLLGTQWYILFNVIAGAIAIPSDLKEVSGLFHFSNMQRWTTLILPGIFPYLITGLVTASGGAWNASIVAEYFHLRGQTLSTLGLGAQISRATDHGHFATLLMATIIMALMVVTINRLVWRPLFQLAETKYRLEG